MTQLTPEQLAVLRGFEERMIQNHPTIADKAPIYFARSHDDTVYQHPEARLAFLGFTAGIAYAKDAFFPPKGTS